MYCRNQINKTYYLHLMPTILTLVALSPNPLLAVHLYDPTSSNLTSNKSSW